MLVPLVLTLVLAPGPAPATDGGVDPVASFLLVQGLDCFARHDALGLGAEAGTLMGWARRHAPVRLEIEPVPVLVGAGDARTSLSPRLARSLSRLHDYQRASLASRSRPVTTEELARALTSEAGAARVQSLFDESLALGIAFGDELAFPELGGEVLVHDGGAELVACDDPTGQALAELAERRAEPERIASLFTEQPEALSLLDPHGQLEREIALWRQRTARGVPLSRRRRPFDLAVETVLRNAANDYILHPRAQLECIASRDWAGRHGGLWHLHPPGWTPSGLVPADAPGPEDLQVARSTGRFLAVVFRPDGFDLHDLEAAGVAEGRFAAPVAYRSEAWRRHFAAQHRRLAARVGLTTSP